MIYYIVLISIIILLIFFLCKKHYTDLSKEKEEKYKLEKEISNLLIEKEHLEDILDQRDEAIQKADKDYRDTIEQYTKDSIERRNELARLEMEREAELNNDYQKLVAAKKELYFREIDKFNEEMEEEVSNCIDTWTRKIDTYENIVNEKKIAYESLIEPLQILEKEKLERLFYCIQINETDKEDIDYLLEVVAPRLKSKDAIPKIVWTEFFQKPTQELMKRLNIEDKPGIYKITNINTNKCYIGKSTKVRQRLIDHIKGAIGISSISDQKIHTAMRNEGIWNWQFEKICDCEKEKLSEMEKYYINFFNAQEYGYNVASGG